MLGSRFFAQQNMLTAALLPGVTGLGALLPPGDEAGMPEFDIKWDAQPALPRLGMAEDVQMPANVMPDVEPHEAPAPIGDAARSTLISEQLMRRLDVAGAPPVEPHDASDGAPPASDASPCPIGPDGLPNCFKTFTRPDTGVLGRALPDISVLKGKRPLKFIFEYPTGTGAKYPRDVDQPEPRPTDFDASQRGERAMNHGGRETLMNQEPRFAAPGKGGPRVAGSAALCDLQKMGCPNDSLGMVEKTGPSAQRRPGRMAGPADDVPRGAPMPDVPAASDAETPPRGDVGRVHSRDSMPEVGSAVDAQRAERPVPAAAAVVAGSPVDAEAGQGQAVGETAAGAAANAAPGESGDGGGNSGDGEAVGAMELGVRRSALVARLERDLADEARRDGIRPTAEMDATTHAAVRRALSVVGRSLPPEVAGSDGGFAAALAEARRLGSAAMRRFSLNSIDDAGFEPLSHEQQLEMLDSMPNEAAASVAAPPVATATATGGGGVGGGGGASRAVAAGAVPPPPRLLQRQQEQQEQQQPDTSLEQQFEQQELEQELEQEAQEARPQAPRISLKMQAPRVAAPSFLQVGTPFPQSLSPLAQHLEQPVHDMLRRQPASIPSERSEPARLQPGTIAAPLPMGEPVGELERRQAPRAPVMMRERRLMFPGFREAEAPPHVYEEAARKQLERAERYAGSSYRRTTSSNPRRRAAASGRVSHLW